MPPLRISCCRVWHTRISCGRGDRVLSPQPDQLQLLQRGQPLQLSSKAGHRTWYAQLLKLEACEMGLAAQLSQKVTESAPRCRLYTRHPALQMQPPKWQARQHCSRGGFY